MKKNEGNLEVRSPCLPMDYYHSICTKKCPQRLARRSAAPLSPFHLESKVPFGLGVEGACSRLPVSPWWSQGCTSPQCWGRCQSAGPALLTALRRLQGLGWFCAVVCLHSGGAPVCGRPPGDRPIHVPRPEAVSPLLGVSGVSSVLPFYLTEYLITTLNVLFSLFTFPQILQNQ